MAKAGSKGKKKEARPDKDAVSIRWERRNIGLFGSGLLAVVVGYFLLSQGDITVAPILLVTGYCILIPLAFIL